MSGVSIILRVKNEGRSLGAVLRGIETQMGVETPEVVVVDSGSTDDTLQIAQRHGAKVISIQPEDFTWGGAINTGIAASAGDIAVILSGHCVAVNEHWLARLLAPFADEAVAATSSRHVADLAIDPFEAVELADDFPTGDAPTEHGPFSNASSAVRRRVWNAIKFDETLVSNEDGEWAKRVRAAGHRVLYCPASAVYHSHSPSVEVVYRRLFWRALTGVQHYPGCRDGQRWYLLYRFVVHCLRDMGPVMRDGRPWEWWRAPFYETVRQGARFAGARAAGRLGTDSTYGALEVPRGLKWMDGILRGLERPGRAKIYG
jgi:glycosyltransferase involved in cell wall biosynthesis